MDVSPPVRWLLRIGSAITPAFLYAPLIVIAIYAFNTTRVQRWPPDGLTLKWFEKALHNSGARHALWVSVEVGLAATAIALVLGTLAAYALARFAFFGRSAVSLLIILPIALPGIVTGMALNATFTQVLGVDLALWTIVVGHATFCVVMVFNNVVARLRRTPASFEDAGGAPPPRSRTRPATSAPGRAGRSARSPSHRCARR